MSRVQSLGYVMWVDARAEPMRRERLRLTASTLWWMLVTGACVAFWVGVARGGIPWNLATDNQRTFGMGRGALSHVFTATAFSVVAVVWAHLLTSRWSLVLRRRGLLLAMDVDGGVRISEPNFIVRRAIVIRGGSTVVIRMWAKPQGMKFSRSDGAQTIVIDDGESALGLYSHVRTGLLEVDSLVSLLESQGCTVDVWPEFGFGGTQEAESGPADAR